MRGNISSTDMRLWPPPQQKTSPSLAIVSAQICAAASMASPLGVGDPLHDLAGDRQIAQRGGDLIRRGVSHVFSVSFPYLYVWNKSVLIGTICIADSYGQCNDDAARFGEERPLTRERRKINANSPSPIPQATEGKHMQRIAHPAQTRTDAGDSGGERRGDRR